MKNNILTFLIFLFISSSVFSQEITKTLINDDLGVMLINDGRASWGKVSEVSVNEFINNSPKIFFFEVVYNGEVLFRESIRKSTPEDADSELMSKKLYYEYHNILLDADKISDADKVKLLERGRTSIVEKVDKKFVDLGYYKIIDNPNLSNKYIVNHPLENMRINIYMVEFK